MYTNKFHAVKQILDFYGLSSHGLTKISQKAHRSSWTYETFSQSLTIIQYLNNLHLGQSQGELANLSISQSNYHEQNRTSIGRAIQSTVRASVLSKGLLSEDIIIILAII